jgi:hypothetical protein
LTHCGDSLLEFWFEICKPPYKEAIVLFERALAEARRDEIIVTTQREAALV